MGINGHVTRDNDGASRPPLVAFKPCNQRLFIQILLERATGIEPAFSAWEADVLPLNYTRAFSIVLLGSIVVL
jgi:hypothetical protein